jgi:hypothetical protein
VSYPNVTPIIERIKKLSYHDITIEIPEDFSFNGRVPYKVRIINGTATFTILAVDETEAEFKLFEYLNTL